MATMMELAEEIIKGRRITKDDDLSIFLTCDLDELRAGADKIYDFFKSRYLMPGFNPGTVS